MIRTATVAAFVVCGLAAGAAAQSATSSQPTITPFSGTLLRVEDQGRVTVALATSEGILLADPLSLETARALKDQFAVRFPNQAVKYVVYTHHHFERASGASVFNQTAEILAHEGFGRERQVSAERLLAGERRGGRTQSALYEAVLAPEQSFRRTHVITLGGQRIALFHVDLHTPDMTVLFFPAQRVLFVGDAVPLALPESVGPSGVKQTIASLRLLESLDFDLLLTSDGSTGSKADIARLREYFEDLSIGVKAGFDKGQSADEVAATLSLDNHATLAGFPVRRARHIVEVYSATPKLRVDLYTAANLVAPQAGTSCWSGCEEIGGWSLGPTVGISVLFGRIRLGGEFVSGRPSTTTVAPGTPVGRGQIDTYGHATQRKDFLVSGTVGYTLVEAPVRLSADAGFALVRTDVGLTLAVPFQPVYFEQLRSTSAGVTFGMQVLAPVTRRLGIVVPVRLYQSSPPLLQGSRVTLVVGAGLAFNFVSKG